MDELKGGLSDDLLDRAIGSIREQAEDTETRIAELQARLSAFREEERLLERLREIREGSKSHGLTRHVMPFVVVPVKHPAVEQSVNLVRDAGRPLHISELMRLLEEEGVNLPGSGMQANLIAHLSRDRRISRPSRGMYALSEWGIAERPAAKRRRRTRVKSRSTDSS